MVNTNNDLRSGLHSSLFGTCATAASKPWNEYNTHRLTLYGMWKLSTDLYVQLLQRLGVTEWTVFGPLYWPRYFNTFGTLAMDAGKLHVCARATLHVKGNHTIDFGHAKQIPVEHKTMGGNGHFSSVIDSLSNPFSWFMSRILQRDSTCG